MPQTGDNILRLKIKVYRRDIADCKGSFSVSLELWPGTNVLEPKKIFGNFENNRQLLIELRTIVAWIKYFIPFPIF